MQTNMCARELTHIYNHLHNWKREQAYLCRVSLNFSSSKNWWIKKTSSLLNEDIFFNFQAIPALHNSADPLKPQCLTTSKKSSTKFTTKFTQQQQIKTNAKTTKHKENSKNWTESHTKKNGKHTHIQIIHLEIREEWKLSTDRESFWVFLSTFLWIVFCLLWPPNFSLFLYSSFSSGVSHYKGRGRRGACSVCERKARCFSMREKWRKVT